jgi:hypothetical protein
VGEIGEEMKENYVGAVVGQQHNNKPECTEDNGTRRELGAEDRRN